MKGKLALVLMLLVAALLLWCGGKDVAKKKGETATFRALYAAARAAAKRQPIYHQKKSQPTTAPPPFARARQAEEAPAAPAAPADEPRDAGDAQSEAAATPLPALAAKGGSVAERTGYSWPVHLAWMLAWLTAFKGAGQAAVVWYWTNVGLAIVALLTAAYVFRGRLDGMRKSLLIVPAAAGVPFLARFLGDATPALLGLVFVLAALACYRRRRDITAGILAALAIFSPVGVAVGVYFFLKRSWAAAASFVIAAALLLLLLPMTVLGPVGAYREAKGYWQQAVEPYFALTGQADVMSSPENQSVWAVLMRHTTHISEIGEFAGDRVQEVVNFNLAQYMNDDYLGYILFATGGLFLVVSVFVLWRKLLERNSPVVGLEGALVVLTVVMLSFATNLSDMVVLLFPLVGVVYTIQNTDLKRVGHHVSYVGLVLATAFFYMSFDPRFKVLGIALAGAVMLWVAAVAAILLFRPSLVSGRVTTTLEPKVHKDAHKPVDLVAIHTSAEKEPVEGEGILPLPEFTKRRTEGRIVPHIEVRENKDEDDPRKTDAEEGQTPEPTEPKQPESEPEKP